MLRLDSDKRKALTALKAQVKELERPEREQAKIARAKARQKREKAIDRTRPEQRQPRERDAGYLAFLRRQPCRIGIVAPGSCRGPIQACHVRYSDARRGKINAGLQTKPPDKYATSCCAHHHAEQHARGNEAAWWAGYGLNGLDEAERQFAEYCGGPHG